MEGQAEVIFNKIKRLQYVFMNAIYFMWAQGVINFTSRTRPRGPYEGAGSRVLGMIFNLVAFLLDKKTYITLRGKRCLYQPSNAVQYNHAQSLPIVGIIVIF